MRALLALLLIVGLGCVTHVVEYTPPGSDEPTLTTKSTAVGRSAMAVDTTPGGGVSAVICQDGTSDWSISRLLSDLGQLTGSVFGGEQTDGIKGPDPASSCKQLLESGDADEEESDPIEVDPDTTIGELVGE